MKIVIVEAFGGPEQLSLVEKPTPVPPPGHVRVKLTSIGMNHADLMARRGEYKLASGDPPFTPGIEGGGIVDAVGDGVHTERVGQRVVLGPDAPRHVSVLAGGGTYRTHYVCKSDQIFTAPDNLPDDQLGTLWLPYLTAWGCLIWRQKLHAGDFVAIPAASSSVALAAAQIVRAFGGISIGMTTSPGKVDAIQSVDGGAYDHMVITHDNGEMRKWHRDLRDITDGHGVDVFFDPVAAGAYLQYEILSLAQRGTVWVYGLLGDPGKVDVTPLIRKHASIRGWSLTELTDAGPATFTPGCEHILQQFAAGRYAQRMAGTFKLDDVQRAHTEMEAGRHVGKFALVP